MYDTSGQGGGRWVRAEAVLKPGRDIILIPGEQLERARSQTINPLNPLNPLIPLDLQPRALSHEPSAFSPHPPGLNHLTLNPVPYTVNLDQLSNFLGNLMECTRCISMAYTRPPAFSLSILLFAV